MIKIGDKGTVSQDWYGKETIRNVTVIRIGKKTFTVEFHNHNGSLRFNKETLEQWGGSDWHPWYFHKLTDEVE